MKTNKGKIKKIVRIFLAVILSAGIIYSCATHDKAGEELKKEASLLDNEGWKPIPSTPTIEEQLTITRKKTAEMTENGHPRYVIALGIGKAPQLETAKALALLRHTTDF